MDFPREKREPRRFEPPPWEKEQFDELVQERADDEAVREPPVEPGAGEADTPREAAGAEPAEPAGVEPGPGGESEEGGSAVDDARVEELMYGLSAEERTSLEGTWKLGMGVAAGMVFGGLVFATYSVIALSRTYAAGPVALIGSLFVGVLGMALLALGVWMGVKNYNKRGAV